MKAQCPWCSTVHDSNDNPNGWYFVCLCGHTRIVWERVDGKLQLLPVAEDMEVKE